MKEIGGYIELDDFQGQEYHGNAIALNCGRNCLAYLIEAKKIKKIYIPYFLCSSVKDVCIKYGVEYELYHIDNCFQPNLDLDIDRDVYIYLVNYYGLLSDTEIKEYKKKWNNIIVDNTQDFFRMPLDNVDTLYTCRKYFGVSDGAYLYTDSKIDRALELDVSMDRVYYILGRYEKTASEFYSESVENNAFFEGEPIKKMSKLTHNILRAINYQSILDKRKRNMDYVSQQLEKVNQLAIKRFKGNFMYPILVNNGAYIRRELQLKKIYVPLLWPDVLEICNKDNLEYRLAEDILPIPIDQRYDLADMEYMCELILQCITE